MVVCELGAAWVSRAEPTTGVKPRRSLRTSFAIATAPATLSCPAPCSQLLKPANGCAVYIRIIFTMFGVRFGFASSSRAAAPATIGEDTEVPLIYINFMFVVG